MQHFYLQMDEYMADRIELSHVIRFFKPEVFWILVNWQRTKIPIVCHIIQCKSNKELEVFIVQWFIFTTTRWRLSSVPSRFSVRYRTIGNLSDCCSYCPCDYSSIAEISFCCVSYHRGIYNPTIRLHCLCRSEWLSQ